MQSRDAQSRRQLFRADWERHQTVDECEMATARDRRSTRRDGAMAGTCKDNFEVNRLSDRQEKEEKANVRKKSPREMACTAGSSEFKAATTNKPRLQLQRRSLTDPGDFSPSSHCSGAIQSERKLLQTRSASNPSLVLSKFKEKIRKKVAKASDWRDSKAMTREKFPESPSLSNPRRTEKIKSFSEGSRDSTGSLRSVSSGGGEEIFCGEKLTPGIICTTKDLEAILGGTTDSHTKGNLDGSLHVDLPPKPLKPGLDKLKKDHSGFYSLTNSPKQSPPVTRETRKFRYDLDTSEHVISEKALFESLLKPQTVKDVEYDDRGETWEIYGADFDPEVLGDAIQRHLNRMESDEDHGEPLGKDKNDPRQGSKNNWARRAWVRVFETVRQKHRSVDSSA